MTIKYNFDVERKITLFTEGLIVILVMKRLRMFKIFVSTRCKNLELNKFPISKKRSHRQN